MGTPTAGEQSNYIVFAIQKLRASLPHIFLTIFKILLHLV